MFQKVKDVVDIVAHIGKHLQLRQGTPMSAKCPFHGSGQEHTPSFKVYSDHFFCYGCQEGGSVIDFEMKLKNLSAIDAARSLCAEYGITVSQEEQERYVKTESVRKQKMDIAAMLPSMRIKRPDIMDYLRKERGFSDSTIADFGVGVGIADNIVVVPIRDKYGRVVAFAKRHLDYKEKALPKWVNDAEDDVYKKGHILFNLDQARRHLGLDQKLILCESYMDVMALWEAGVRTGVAYCSSKVTKEQIEEIKKVVTPGTTILFGACNDKVAQDKLLANRTLIHTFCPEVHIRAIVIPKESKDLNDVLIREGGLRLAEIVSQSVSMDRYLLDQVLETEPSVDLQYRKAKSVVSIAENSLSQQDLIKYLSQKWGKEEATVRSYMTGAALQTANVQFKNVQMLISEYEHYVRTIDQHRIHFGWPDYDKLTRGMKPGDVVQFIGSAGTGKTMWAQQLMMNVGATMPHIPMISYSLEQKGIMALERYMQMEGGMFAQDVERWMTPSDPAHNTRIFNTAQRLCQKLSNLLVCDAGGLTLQQIESHTREAGFYHFGKPVGIIFIDYLGYLKWQGNWKNIYEMVSLIAREQKEVAKRLDCVVVSLHQVTKTKPGEPIEAYHARDSGAVHESADIMIGAWRPELQEGLSDADKRTKLGLWRTKFLKNRYGPQDSLVDFKFDPTTLRLTKWDPPNLNDTTAVQAAIASGILKPAPGFDPVNGKERASGSLVAP